MRLVEQPLEVLERAVLRMHGLVLGDVVAIVAQRRRIERQYPERVDVERLDVVELLNQSRKITEAIAIAVAKCLDVGLVDDRVLVPERVVGGDGGCGSIGHRAAVGTVWRSALKPEDVPRLKNGIETNVVA
jgi:hypothetical protein